MAVAQQVRCAEVRSAGRVEQHRDHFLHAKLGRRSPDGVRRNPVKASYPLHKQGCYIRIESMNTSSTSHRSTRCDTKVVHGRRTLQEGGSIGSLTNLLSVRKTIPAKSDRKMEPVEHRLHKNAVLRG